MHSFLLTLSALFLWNIQPSKTAPIHPLQQTLFNDHSASVEDIVAALKDASIIPDVLSPFTPTHSLTLTYPSTHSSVSLGNNLPPSSVSSPPSISIHSLSSPSTLSPTRALSSNTTYTLVLTDPDATSRADPVQAEMCHWIATGISLDSSSSESPALTNAYTLDFSDESTIKELIEYFPPSPPPKTGEHRYVFVLLAREKGDDDGDLKKPKERPHWGYGEVGRGVRDWAGENGLVALGANFFYAENPKQ